MALLQNHGGCPDHPGIGVLRSDDYGDTWRSIADGLPSDFGLPIVAHPHDPDTVYVVPLEGMTRTCPGGAPAVWRSENGGGSWKRLGKGLPKQQSFFTVLRDAMGHGRSRFACTLFRNDDRATLDRPGRRGGLELRLRFVAAHQLCQSRPGVKLMPATTAATRPPESGPPLPP